jgi:hypothetical protein
MSGFYQGAKLRQLEVDDAREQLLKEKIDRLMFE